MARKGGVLLVIVFLSIILSLLLFPSIAVSIVGYILLFAVASIPAYTGLRGNVHVKRREISRTFEKDLQITEPRNSKMDRF
ncbi:MAG: hypothetical protein ACFFFG_07585 [Candidatus Thorarchaeota archaeon]